MSSQPSGGTGGSPSAEPDSADGKANGRKSSNPKPPGVEDTIVDLDNTASPQKSTTPSSAKAPSGRPAARSDKSPAPSRPPAARPSPGPSPSGGQAPEPGIAPVKDDPGQATPQGAPWNQQPPQPRRPSFRDRKKPSFGRPGAKPSGAELAPGSGRTTPRRAQLQVARLEPWSVMKFSFVMSLVCFVILLVAVVILYVILSGLGVFSELTETLNSLTRDQNDKTGGIDAGSWFSFARVFGYTVLVGALNVLLITALSTVGSVIYNQAADLVGGIDVTLKESE